MTGIYIYQAPGRAAQVSDFIESLAPKLREKILRQLIFLPHTPRAVSANDKMQENAEEKM